LTWSPVARSNRISGQSHAGECRINRCVIVRRHLTFANVVSLTALFFALAGGSYAAISNDGGGGRLTSTAYPAEPPQGTDQAQEAPASSESPSAETIPTDDGGDPNEPTTVSPEPPTVDSAGRAGEVSQPTPMPPRESSRERPSNHAAVADSVVHEAEYESPDHNHRANGGPPPWAPAYGYRCQQDAAPGSGAFHSCIESSKP